MPVKALDAQLQGVRRELDEAILGIAWEGKIGPK